MKTLEIFFFVLCQLNKVKENEQITDFIAFYKMSNSLELGLYMYVCITNSLIIIICVLYYYCIICVLL